MGQIVFMQKNAVERQDTAGRIRWYARKRHEDIQGMKSAAGILTSRGGMTSHSAVPTRDCKCCVAGAGELDVNEKNKELKVKGYTFKEGTGFLRERRERDQGN